MKPNYARAALSNLPFLRIFSNVSTIACFCLSASLLIYDLEENNLSFSSRRCSVFELSYWIFSNIYCFLYSWTLAIRSTVDHFSSLFSNSYSLLIIICHFLCVYVFDMISSFSYAFTLIYSTLPYRVFSIILRTSIEWLSFSAICLLLTSRDLSFSLCNSLYLCSARSCCLRITCFLSSAISKFCCMTFYISTDLAIERLWISSLSLFLAASNIYLFCSTLRSLSSNSYLYRFNA
jgi:hypothetical protein